MTRRIILLAALLGVLPLAVLAQETPTPEPARTVTVRPGLTVSDQDVFAVYVSSVTVNGSGQFASVEVYAAVADTGFVRLTPCGLVVECAPIVVRADGVVQGEGWPLVPGGE